jgi:hypothetical protein
MGRGAVTRRWIAGAGGVLVNALVLGGLALLERAPPVGEAPVMVLELERPERAPELRPALAKAGASSAPAQAHASASSAAPSEGMPAAAEPAESGPPVEPAWRVDPKAVERWKITEGDPDFGWGRYHRACYRQSNEHMTPEEKERCYDAWGGRRDKRPSSKFVGPIDETKWETPEPSPRKPPSADQERRRHRDLCRAERSRRKADPSAPPMLRQGACP